MKIDLVSYVPFYEQIKAEIKRQISLGILKPRESLPSIRDLAEELIINPNTVARAYRELEQDGFIIARKGVGSFVSEDSAVRLKETRISLAAFALDQAIAEAEKLDFSSDEIRRIFDERMRLAGENEGENNG
jgi:GntR family transcriptional regulator